jgi:hypothetical protein
MKPDSNSFPPEHAEIRITAMLLGELSPDDAETVRRAIELDPEWARLRDRIEQTLRLVRQAVECRDAARPEPVAGLRFSDERRKELLGRFKKVLAVGAPGGRTKELPWFIPMSIAAVLIVLIAVAALVVPDRNHYELAYRVETPGEPGLTHSDRMGRESTTDFGFWKGAERADISGRGHVGDKLREGAELRHLEGRTTAVPVMENVAAPDLLMERYGSIPASEPLLARPAVPARGVGLETAATGSGRGEMFAGVGGGGSSGNEADKDTVDLAASRGGDLDAFGGRAAFSKVVPETRGKAVQLGDLPLLGRTLRSEALQPAPGAEEGRELIERLWMRPGLAEPSGPVETPVTRYFADGLEKSTVVGAPPQHSVGELALGLAAKEEGETRGRESEVLLRGDPGQLARVVRGFGVRPEVTTRSSPVSTFSLNVSDVSFKLAAASLEQGQLPDPGTIRSEEFINAFDYRDPAPGAGSPVGLTWERATHPFAHDRELIRFAVRTAAQGRERGRALNLVLLLDNSGSMERADRVGIMRESLNVLAKQLEPQDKVSVVAFARTPRLWVDGLPGDRGEELIERVGHLTPQGGTDIESALQLGYETARRHYLAEGGNRVILLTDGAANLGNLDPEFLKQSVEAHRQQGIALDCFGIGWEGYNDDLLEITARHGDGRYGFVNSPEDAATGFADQLAGALQVAAADVKVQIEFNADRVSAYRQIGYERHQLAEEQFRDNAVDAGELGAAETGNALYSIQVNPEGRGPIALARVRFKDPGTGEYREHEWQIPYNGRAPVIEASSPAMRLACVAGASAEWLASSPFASEVTADRLLALLQGVHGAFEPDPRPAQLENVIRQAQALGKD